MKQKDWVDELASTQLPRHDLILEGMMRGLWLGFAIGTLLVTFIWVAVYMKDQL